LTCINLYSSVTHNRLIRAQARQSLTTARMETGPHESEGEMIRHGSGETMATLTTAATLQREATDQHLVFAWGQALFKELDRVWA
jgi:hypothetical protein